MPNMQTGSQRRRRHLIITLVALAAASALSSQTGAVSAKSTGGTVGSCIAVEDAQSFSGSVDIESTHGVETCHVVSGSVRLCYDDMPAGSIHVDADSLHEPDRICYEVQCPATPDAIESRSRKRNKRAKTTICVAGSTGLDSLEEPSVDDEESEAQAESSDELNDDDANPFGTSGIANATASACGDGDGSGTITASDALLTLKTAVGATTCSVAFIDTNGDGLVTATDALAVLRTAVNLPVALTCPVDTDADCLPDIIETANGTDPANADSNGNTLDDGDEDPDFDGLSACDELKICTDPISSDTDGDGLTDGEEVETFDTDPTNPDSDDDGFDDRDEILAASDPNDSAVVPFTVVSTSPINGETGVAVSRETIIELSNPLSTMALVDNTTIWAEFASQQLNTRLQVSADRQRVTLFYIEPLPASARIRVFIDGDRLVDNAGLAIDADRDGHAGGLGTIEFDTLTLTVVPGTSVCGRVFASELAEGDMGASINVPLAGVRITVDGMEDELFAVTDEMGDFRIEPAPAGRFFVHIDGLSATNPGLPDGAYYPIVGKPFDGIAGQEVIIGDVFLPLIVDYTLQPVSQSQDTEIGFPPSVVAAFPEFEDVSITVPAGSLFSDAGTVGGMVGLAPVPPDRLPGTLPDGLNFPLVITVQTNGPQNFDIPAPVCFPNLADPTTSETLEAGSKTALWSFDHDTGRWKIVGPMTVTNDGTMACTDPGVGIRAPGWHGTQPGAGASGGPIGDGGCDGAGGAPGGGGGGPGGGGPGGGDPAQKTGLTAEQGSGCTSPPGYDPSNMFNGCGPENIPFGIPGNGDKIVPDNPNDLDGNGSGGCQSGDESFLPACKNHDICYSTCGSGQVECDNTFGDEMNVICSCYSADNDPIGYAKCIILAELYKKAVGAGGADSHDSAQQGNCDCPDPCPSEGDGGGNITLADPNARAGVLTIPEDKRLTGTHHFAILNLDRGEVVLRGMTGSNGIAHEQLLLEPDTNYQQILLNAATLEEGWANFRTGPAGSDTPIPVTFINPPISWDLDGDGLHDNGEFVMGTNAFDEDTDHDGILDGAEVQQGLDPLGELIAATGLIASSDTPGTAVDIDAFDDLAAVADSGGGVSLFNVFNGMDPTIIGQVDTPGSARAVAIDGNYLAVADGAAGLTVLDISFPDEPSILHQIPLDAAANSVAAAGGVAYVGLSGGAEQLIAVDLESGLVSEQVDVGAAVEDLAIERETLFVLTAAKLQSFDLEDVFLNPLSEVATSGFIPESITGRKRVFVGGGYAYTTSYPGFDVFDVTMPGDLQKVGNATDAGFNSFKQIVVNGSGLGVATAGVVPRDDGTHHVSLYDLSEPTDTTRLLVQFQTPGIARALSIYNGIAYVADGEAGMQVISYLSYDRQAMPPTVALTSNFAPGVAEESALMRVTAAVTDDVQVRNVELYIDGKKTATDGNFPFEFRFATPLIADQASFTMQARASDTGGNATFSEEMTITLTEDATPPRVLRVAPKSSSTTFLDDPVNAVSATFNEPLDATTVQCCVGYVQRTSRCNDSRGFELSTHRPG
jgi:hypothetical protein